MPDGTKAKEKPPKESAVGNAWKAASPRDDADVEFAIDAWKTTVDVQMHFNDICMKIRNLAITVLVGAVGFAGYSMKEALEFDFREFHVPVGTIIALAGLVGWTAFYGMDRHWYHV